MNRSNLQLYIGNSRYLSFRLRHAGQVGVWNVSSYSTIEVEFRRVGDDVPMTPVACNELAPGADWSTGLVKALVTPMDITARVGTYEYAVTLYQTPLELTAGAGRLEVLDRPASLYSAPDGASWTSTNLMAFPNASGATIYAGQPVVHAYNGMILADGSDATKIADGICVSDSAASTMCLFINNGVLTLPDWSVPFGAAGFPVGTTVSLGPTAGALTTSTPSLPTYALRQTLGQVANETQTLNIALDYTVVL